MNQIYQLHEFDPSRIICKKVKEGPNTKIFFKTLNENGSANPLIFKIQTSKSFGIHFN